MSSKIILPYTGITPTIDKTVFIADGAAVIGDVNIGKGSGVWFNTVLRGDTHPIKIGKYSNIQDNSTVHVMHNHPAEIGDYVTAGHGAIIHGCIIGNNCLIGMAAIILSYAEIGDNCIIAAGSVVPERKKIPPNSLVMGVPGKIVRTVTPEEIEAIRNSAIDYKDLAQKYLMERKERENGCY
ncbi:MAG: gamma carbonic anhydrase family protein [Negativicutes bacterium]|nr:gamma carbonic anhydrase family protein [Negativicutes bacterium]